MAFSFDGELPFALSEKEEWQFKLIEGLVDRPEPTTEEAEKIASVVASFAGFAVSGAADTAVIDLPTLFTNLTIALIQQLPPELVIKFIIKKPLLLEITGHDELKDYWSKYINQQLFVVADDGGLSIHENYESNEEELPAHNRIHRMKIRPDLNFAEQAASLYCFIQDKNRPEDHWRLRHHWRILAVKFGSIHAAYRAIKFHMDSCFKINEPSIYSSEGHSLVNRSLDIAKKMAATHGETGFYLLALFCFYVANEFYRISKRDIARTFYQGAYQAMLFGQSINTLDFSAISLQNLTFGTPAELIERHFKYNPPMALLEEARVKLVSAEASDHEMEQMRPHFLTFFNLPAKTRGQISAVLAEEPLAKRLHLDS